MFFVFDVGLRFSPSYIQTSELELENFFSNFGEVVDVRIVCDRKTGYNKGWVALTYKTSYLFTFCNCLSLQVTDVRRASKKVKRTTSHKVQIKLSGFCTLNAGVKFRKRRVQNGDHIDPLNRVFLTLSLTRHAFKTKKKKMGKLSIWRKKT